MSNHTIESGNREAILNVYSYIASKGKKNKAGSSFEKIVDNLESHYKENPEKWTEEDAAQLELLQTYMKDNPGIKNLKLVEQTIDKDGMTASAFQNSNGDVTVVFRGTGKGEWIDNGEGLSGIPESNIYYTYDRAGNIIHTQHVEADYATDQQVEALNWFNCVAAKHGWNESTNITISGHSKGGNKAQFITMNSELIDTCYSFDGQGFSPEAIEAFGKKYGEKFETRRKKMHSFSTYNDYVNILGVRLIPEDQIYYFESPKGDENLLYYHYPDAMLGQDGRFNRKCEQGELSIYLERLSEEIMELDPEERKFATLGIMNILQKVQGKGTPVNGDYVSFPVTVGGIIQGLGVAVDELLEMAQEGAQVAASDLLDEIRKKYGRGGETAAIVMSMGAISFSAVLQFSYSWKKKKPKWAVDAVKWLGKELKRRNKDVYTRIRDFCYSVVRGLENFVSKYFGGGTRGAISTSSIKVNTGTLRTYAARLKSINGRLSELDRRMDKLYLKVGLLDIWNLLQADLLTGYSWRLERCIEYLNDTASDFENIERSISSYY